MHAHEIKISSACIFYFLPIGLFFDAYQSEDKNIPLYLLLCNNLILPLGCK